MALSDLRSTSCALRQTLVPTSSLRTLTCGLNQAALNITSVPMHGVQVIVSTQEHSTLSMVP